MVNLVGKADLRLASELLCLNYQTLRKYAQMSDFPDSHTVAGIRVYDVAEIAAFMGVPLRAK